MRVVRVLLSLMLLSGFLLQIGCSSLSSYGIACKIFFTTSPSGLEKSVASKLPCHSSETQEKTNSKNCCCTSKGATKQAESNTNQIDVKVVFISTIQPFHNKNFEILFSSKNLSQLELRYRLFNRVDTTVHNILLI